ncbi:MAG: DUF4236 domain-containing protein, partial [Candidatus Ventricola sp.]|nr:DUF4236 domain-containing protein [Candidatus Ventricola sp.]
MRFRKSIKVTKGVKLNLSKGGASFTVGSGLPVSLNVGTKGAYLNWSIPGTGVYDRVRLDKVLKEKLGGVLGFGTAAAEEEEPEEKSAKKTGTKAAAKKSSATKTTAKPTSKKTASARTETKKEPARPSDEEMNAIAQQIALVNIHRQAIDVSKKASGTLNADEAEAQIEAWLSESEAPIEFSVQPEVIESKGTVMIDLDLPEIEDMPQDKLAELADGTIKIKKKTKKEQVEDYRTCVFGLGEYVASHVLAEVPQAKKVVVSAYTQRRSEKTGELLDVFIYSVVFSRSDFTKDYQDKDPYEFCQKLPSR